MKSWITNLDEVLELVDQFSQYDELSMKTIICMLIDVVSEKCKEPAGTLRNWYAIWYVQSMKNWDPSLHATRRKDYDNNDSIQYYYSYLLCIPPIVDIKARNRRAANETHKGYA